MSAQPTVLAADYIRERVWRQVRWETQPHYWLLTDDLLEERGALAKVGPPLRSADDRDAVLRAVINGPISHLSSDHAPRTRHMKLSQPGILEAPFGGTSGTELLFPLAYHNLANSSRVSMSRLVELTSTNAAKAYGLYPRKGTLRPGADADVIVMPRDYEPRPVSSDNLHGLSDYTLYAGVETAPPPRTVIRHGRVAIHDGEMLSNPPAEYLGRPSA
jgi:dihydropyrimidinase